MKTNKEKCLDMWKWIQERNSTKEMWAAVHPEEAKELVDHSGCYACLEAFGNGGCEDCPVLWINPRYKDLFPNRCTKSKSPYMIWVNNTTSENAQKVIDIIEKTWKE